MTTHDYRIRGWGHDYVIHAVHNGGLEIDISGWGSGINEGDYLLMAHAKGEARYEIESIRYVDDPADMWFAKAVFAPRQG